MNILDTLSDMINISFMGDGIQKFAGIITLSIVILWILIIIGIAIDISKRTQNIWIQIFCIIVATIAGPLGGLIYLIIRPRKNNYSIDLLSHSDTIIVCNGCNSINNFGYNYCTSCGKSLKIQCKECKKMIDPSFEYCGNCGAPNL